MDAALKYPSIDSYKRDADFRAGRAQNSLRFRYRIQLKAGQDLPESCYQFFLIYFNNRKTFLPATIRAGSAHCQNDFCGYLERFLPILARRGKSVFRGDSGFHNERDFDRLSDQVFTVAAFAMET